MTSKIVSIEIYFPCEVEVSNKQMRGIDTVLASICADWEAKHPGRIMWPFGCGAKMLANPLALSDDEPIPFDESVLQFEVAEREAYAGERNFVAAHEWHERFGLTCCRVCGIVQRADGKNKPCKGPMKLRPLEGPLPETDS